MSPNRTERSTPSALQIAVAAASGLGVMLKGGTGSCRRRLARRQPVAVPKRRRAAQGRPFPNSKDRRSETYLAAGAALMAPAAEEAAMAALEAATEASEA